MRHLSLTCQVTAAAPGPDAAAPTKALPPFPHRITLPSLRPLPKPVRSSFVKKLFASKSNYRVVQKKGTVLLSTSLAWLAAAGQKLPLNFAPFLLPCAVHFF